MEYKIVAQLENTSPHHHMAVIDDTIYILDGNKVLQLQVPVRSFWKRVWDLIKLK